MKRFRFQASFKLLALPLRRARQLRCDDRGNVLLLSGMMAFMLAIFGLITMDLSQAIYNRILAQNAVDAAADAAALWQARGCNMLQDLNNVHYSVDNDLVAIENMCLDACEVGFLAHTLEEIPYLGEAAAVVAAIACPFCDAASDVNNIQPDISNAILALQAGVSDATPIVALFAGNDAAAGSGADDLATVTADYFNQIQNNVLGTFFPSSLSPLSKVISGAASVVSDALRTAGVTVYALPLNPGNLSLGVSKTDGQGSPWQYSPSQIAINMGEAPVFGCGLQDPSPGPWGWNDTNYVGQPGYMTWIAGKTNQAELAGLGFLTWLNGSNPPAQVAYTFAAQGSPLNQEGLPVYTGSVSNQDSTTWLTIPAFIAVASSQLEHASNPQDTSDIVVPYNPNPDAAPRLIKVILPLGGLVITGQVVGIYH